MSGSTPTIRIAGWYSLRRIAQPMAVPEVPRAATSIVTLPSVCSQISTAVPW